MELTGEKDIREFRRGFQRIRKLELICNGIVILTV